MLHLRLEGENLKIGLYDKVLLKSGYTASIAEILEEEKAYIADIDYPDDIETEIIERKDIEKIIHKAEF